jgi:hypothetical protein
MPYTVAQKGFAASGITFIVSFDVFLLLPLQVGSSLWRSMRGWRWTTVLVNALYWGVFFFTCNVIISKFTVDDCWA